MEHDPWIIPNYGCASFDSRGALCRGSLEIDKNKYCLKCKCLYSKNVFNDNEKNKESNLNNNAHRNNA